MLYYYNFYYLLQIVLQTRCEAYFISELDKTLWSIKPVVWKKEEEKNTRKSADKNTLWKSPNCEKVLKIKINCI